MRAFRSDYPEARALLLYRGRERISRHGVSGLPSEEFLVEDDMRPGGDSLQNSVLPTSGVTMGVLGLAGLRWEKWARWLVPLLVLWVLFAAPTLIPPVLMKWGPG